MWHYKRGAARVRLKKLDAAESDLQIALASDSPRWIRGRAMVETGRIAALRGNHDGAEAQFREAIEWCESDRDRLCATDARRELNRR
jgi:hypothetical protein